MSSSRESHLPLTNSQFTDPYLQIAVATLIDSQPSYGDDSTDLLVKSSTIIPLANCRLGRGVFSSSFVAWSFTDATVQFPNGRWGDQASPAFGELDLSLSLPHTPSGATTLWGHPLTISDLTKLFARFCRGDLKSLPWCDQGPSKETSVISEPLARINEEGFLTINSQPRVDGVKSNDPSFGWGPKDGYVYQKVSPMHR